MTYKNPCAGVFMGLRNSYIALVQQNNGSSATYMGKYEGMQQNNVFLSDMRTLDPKSPDYEMEFSRLEADLDVVRTFYPGPHIIIQEKPLGAGQESDLEIKAANAAAPDALECPEKSSELPALHQSQ